METDYRRDPQGTYMVLSHPETEEPDMYALRMILKNRIPGLLQTGQETMNGQLRLVYEITSMRSLEDIMEKEKIGRETFRTLIRDLGSCADRSREYLLGIDQILFLPDYIFRDQSGDRFCFCFDPCYKGNYQADIRELFDRILGSIEYEDPDYVKLVYELHVAVQKDNFRLSDLSEIMSRTDESETVSVRGMFEEAEESSIEMQDPVPEFLSERKLQEPKNSGIPGSTGGFFDKLKDRMAGKRVKEKGRQYGQEDPPDRYAGTTTVFLGETQDPDAPFLVGIGKQKGTVIKVHRFPFRIGKLEGETECILDSPSVSRMHARISEDPMDPAAGCLIEDLNSTNGTFVNGMRIEPFARKTVRPGDVIRFADREYILQFGKFQANNPCIYPSNEL